MVLMAEPLARAVEAARGADAASASARPRVICLSAAGQPLTDARVKQLADEGTRGQGLILVCGRYEGIDQRFIDEMVDEEISIGDFVLSGGEIAAMSLIDAVVRQLPGALKEESVRDESFADGCLDAPQYTRPESWRGRTVPAVLLSGDHARIEQWRRSQALERTRSVRPDLLHPASLA
jgi:tRNA (guanine37-N1)-methyltransferase